MNRQRRMALLSLALLGVAVLAGALILWSLTRPAATPATQDGTPQLTATATTTPRDSTAEPAAAATSGRRPTSGPLSYAPVNAAEEVAVEAAKIMTTWTPANDLDESVSAPRAAHLMTPERAKKIIVSDRGTSTPEWIDAAAGNWTSEPQVTIVPDSEPDKIHVNVTWLWREPGGKTHQGQTRRQFVFTTTDDPDHPQITDYDWQNLY